MELHEINLKYLRNGFLTPLFILPEGEEGDQHLLLVLAISVPVLVVLVIVLILVLLYRQVPLVLQSSLPSSSSYQTLQNTYMSGM